MATTTAPTTAAAARQLADQLASQESELAKARNAARNDAVFTTAEQILAVDAVQAAEDRDHAVRAWEAAAADPAATVTELLGAFVAMKSASAKRAAVVAQASGILNQVRPLRNEHSGQPQPYRFDTTDSLAVAQFGDALEDVIRTRAEHAAQTAQMDVQGRATDAGEQAAAKVKV